MGKKSVIAIVCVLVLLIAGAVGAYAWDNSKSGEIAEGVRVGNIELGGLDEAAATDLLKHELVKPLEKPIEVTYDGEDYTLYADDLKVRADIDGMVAEALSASREDPLPSRVVRYVTGDKVEHRIQPDVAYSDTAVERFVAGVAAKVNTEAQDATVEPTLTSLEPIEGKNGRALQEDQLRADIKRVLEDDGNGARTVKAKVDVVKPDVTTADVAAQYPTYITVDRSTFTLRLYENLELSKEYTVAIGQQGYDTPTGAYAVQSKQVDPVWSVPDSDWAGKLAGTTVPGGVPENPLKARWLGFDGAAGIHGTDDVGSLGSAASHGCVRMAITDVIALYDQVDVGTPVYIQ
ncbi:MAG: L,D-transpeptidase family protein [Solirubrobacterales bacterium]